MKLHFSKQSFITFVLFCFEKIGFITVTQRTSSVVGGGAT